MEHSRGATDNTDARIGCEEIAHGGWRRAPHYDWTLRSPVCETTPGKDSTLCSFVGKCKFSLVEELLSPRCSMGVISLHGGREGGLLGLHPDWVQSRNCKVLWMNHGDHSSTETQRHDQGHTKSLVDPNPVQHCCHLCRSQGCRGPRSSGPRQTPQIHGQRGSWGIKHADRWRPVTSKSLPNSLPLPN